jgi:hypothetical protein
MTESRRAFDSFFRRYSTQNLVEKCAEFVKTKRPEVDVASRTRTRASGE